MSKKILEEKNGMSLQTDGKKLNVKYPLVGNVFVMEEQRKQATLYLLKSMIKYKDGFKEETK